MATVPKKQRVTAGVFFGFLILLFLSNVFISLPISSVDITATGHPSGGTHDWYVLPEDSYTVIGIEGETYMRSSFLPWLLGKTYTYFRVQVNQGPGSPYSMLVRAYGKEGVKLKDGIPVKLYGMVSNTINTPTGLVASESCLNDNGDTILSRCVQSFIFLVATVGCSFLLWMIVTGRQFKGKRIQKINMLLVVPLCVFLVSASGCKVEATPEETVTSSGMTEEELRLMRTCYPGLDDNLHIELLDYQEDALQQLRAGLEYTALKYPSKVLRFDLFESATKFTGYATLIDTETKAMVRIRTAEDGYSCVDNYYGLLIAGDYTAYLDDLLLGLGYSVKSSTRFPELLNGDLGEKSALKDFLKKYPKMTKDTDLFVSESDFLDIDTEALSNILKGHGVYGSFTLYSAPDMTLDVGTLGSMRRDFAYKCFNCF